MVLASLLVSAGLGSTALSASGWPLARVTRTAGPLLTALLAGLGPLFHALLHLPLALGVLVVLGVTFPLGFLMGTFFPAGLQAVRDRVSAFVPWAWGINGCASVYGSIVAILIALVHGFNAALLAGALVYVAAFAAVPAAAAPEEAPEAKRELCTAGQQA